MAPRIFDLAKRVRGVVRDLLKEEAPPPLTPKDIEEIHDVVIALVSRNLYALHRFGQDIARFHLAVREFVDASAYLEENRLSATFGGSDEIERQKVKRMKALQVIETHLNAWEGES